MGSSDDTWQVAVHHEDTKNKKNTKDSRFRRTFVTFVTS